MHHNESIAVPDDAASLNNLHDIVLPGDVSWWPPAVGWYVVFALLLLVAIRFLWHAWVQWNVNAYRREALVELSEACDAETVAEILRRAALVFAPRNAIAGLSGEAWVKWLTDRCAKPLPPDVRELLATGVYQRAVRPANETNSLDSMKAYASHWIREHSAILDSTTPDRASA